MDSGQTKCNCCSNITDERSLRSLFLLLLTEKVLVLILLSCIFKMNMQDFLYIFIIYHKQKEKYINLIMQKQQIESNTFYSW